MLTKFEMDQFKESQFMDYRIAVNFDGGNIDGFDASLAIHQNFPFQYF